MVDISVIASQDNNQLVLVLWQSNKVDNFIHCLFSEWPICKPVCLVDEQYFAKGLLEHLLGLGPGLTNVLSNELTCRADLDLPCC